LASDCWRRLEEGYLTLGEDEDAAAEPFQFVSHSSSAFPSSRRACCTVCCPVFAGHFSAKVQFHFAAAGILLPTSQLEIVFGSDCSYVVLLLTVGVLVDGQQMSGLSA